MVFVLVLTPLLFLSCSKGENGTDDELSNKKALRVVIPTNMTQVKALALYSAENGTNREDTINTLRIELIKSDGTASWTHNYASSDFTVTQLNLPTYDADVTDISLEDIDADLLDNVKEVRVYANSSADYPLSTSEPTTLMQVPTAAIAAEIPLVNGTSGSPIAMSGKTNVDFSTGVYSATIYLSRDIAKIRVKVVKDATCSPSNLTIDYDNIEVKINGVPTKAPYMSWLNSPSENSSFNTKAGMLAKSIGFIDYSNRAANIRRITTTAPAPLTTAEITALYAGYTVDSCYVNPQNRTQADYTVNGDKTTVEISIPTMHGGSTYNNVYKIPIRTNNTFDILPNHIYTLRCSILGDGADDVSTQLIVCPWEAVESMEPVGAGLTISPEDATVYINTLASPYTSTDQVTLNFTSNVEVKIHETTGWLDDVTIPANTGTGSFVVKYKNGESILDENGDLAPATITLKAGTTYSTFQIYPRVDKFYIPDASFRQTLKANYPKLMEGDSLVIFKARAYKGELNLDKKGVTDLTGINYFESLDTLNIAHNQIATVDLTSCKSLKKAILGDDLRSHGYWKVKRDGTRQDFNNSVIALNFSDTLEANKVLTTLNLTGLDSLEYLNVSFTGIQNLNVDNLPALQTLHAYATRKLSTFSFAGTTFNTSGKAEIELEESSIKTLNFSNKQNLGEIYVGNRMNNDSFDNNAQLNLLNVNNCNNLETLAVGITRISSLDISTNHNLKNFALYSNIITDFSNDFTLNNPNIESISMRFAKGNNKINVASCSSLSYICLDSVIGISNPYIDLSNCTSLENIGGNMSNCSLFFNNNPSLQFIGEFYHKYKTDDLPICVKYYEILFDDIFGSSAHFRVENSDFLSHCPALKSFSYYGGYEDVDFSSNIYLECIDSYSSRVDVTNCGNLQCALCDSIKTSGQLFNNLYYIFVNSNTTLDLSLFPNLKQLSARRLKSLTNLGSATHLKTLDCSSGDLGGQSFDISSLTSLESIFIGAQQNGNVSLHMSSSFYNTYWNGILDTDYKNTGVIETH